MSRLMIRHRETVGTLGLLLFLTFVFTAWVGALGAGVAQAADNSGNAEVIREEAKITNNRLDLKLLIKVAGDPVTEGYLSTPGMITLKYSGGQVQEEVYFDVYAKNVDGAVYYTVYLTQDVGINLVNLDLLS